MVNHCRHYHIGITCLDCKKVLAHLENMIESLRNDIGSDFKLLIAKSIAELFDRSHSACKNRHPYKAGSVRCNILLTEQEGRCSLCEAFHQRFDELMILYSHFSSLTYDQALDEVRQLLNWE